MNPVNPFPAVAALAAAVATAHVMTKRFGGPTAQGRFASIDGLRGFLAFFVFLHHSCIWYFYLRSGRWEVPPSNLYTHFGQSSVALFFMITGFLFFSKLIEGRSREIDWVRLYVSRFLRLVPLYLLTVLLLLLLVCILSDGAVNESIPRLIVGTLRWLSFTAFGAPDLNGIEHTFIIVAGVTWSLPYEWAFYFSLPLLALAIGVRPNPAYVAVGLLTFAFAARNPSFHYLSFMGGIAAAFLVRFDLIRRLAVNRLSSFIAASCLIATVITFPSAYGVQQFLLLTVFFVLIASGNGLFGFLLSPASRLLGEFAYSLYLIHGVLLFLTFKFVLGLERSRELSVEQHWAVVICVTPVLVALCFLTFTYIEYPAMRKIAGVTSWVRSFNFGRVKV